MFKYAILSVLALGCYSQVIYPSHNFQSFGHEFIPIHHWNVRGFIPKIGYGLGGNLGYYANVYPGVNRVGTLGRHYTHQYRPFIAHYIAQPYHTGYTQGELKIGQTVPVSSIRPSVSYLTQHHSEPHQEIVQAAVQQLGRTVEYKSMPYHEEPIHAQVVEVEPSEVPLHIHFKTKSSSVLLSQSHQQREPQEAQVAQTQDEPARLIHEIQKPIIQEVREVITPYRQVTQEIQPVVEAVHTVVTKAEGQRQQFVAPVHSTGTHVERKVPITQSVDSNFVGGNTVQPIQMYGFQHDVAVQPVTTNVATTVPQTVQVYEHHHNVVQPVHMGSFRHHETVPQPIQMRSFKQETVHQPSIQMFGFKQDVPVVQPIAAAVTPSVHQPVHTVFEHKQDIVSQPVVASISQPMLTIKPEAVPQPIVTVKQENVPQPIHMFRYQQAYNDAGYSN